MEREGAFKAWSAGLKHEDWISLSHGPNQWQKVFKAGWEAAVIELGEAQAEPWGTLEGAERYLEARDRESFMELRREKLSVGLGNRTYLEDLLQDRWIAYGEAWGIVQRLRQPQEQATGI